MERGSDLPMPSKSAAVSQGMLERDLLDQWTGSAGQNEIGLLDLVVLDEWIAQLAPDGGPGSTE